jgi:hypothetical protein
MFPMRFALLAAIAAVGLFPLPTLAGDPIKIENPLGFHTAGPAEFLRASWDSLKDKHRMQGNVSDHLTREQIDTIIMLEVHIAIALGPREPGLQGELLGFMADGNRFQTGPLPEGFDKQRPMKYLVALVRTKKGDYGLITRYREFTVLELKGRVGVAPVGGAASLKPAVPAK